MKLISGKWPQVLLPGPSSGWCHQGTQEGGLWGPLEAGSWEPCLASNGEDGPGVQRCSRGWQRPQAGLCGVQFRTSDPDQPPPPVNFTCLTPPSHANLWRPPGSRAWALGQASRGRAGRVEGHGWEQGREGPSRNEGAP